MKSGVDRLITQRDQLLQRYRTGGACTLRRTARRKVLRIVNSDPVDRRARCACRRPRGELEPFKTDIDLRAFAASRAVQRPQVPELHRSEKATPHRARILELLDSCKGNLVRVHEELTAAGVTLSCEGCGQYAASLQSTKDAKRLCEACRLRERRGHKERARRSISRRLARSPSPRTIWR
jgi:hypothetical protein